MRLGFVLTVFVLLAGCQKDSTWKTFRSTEFGVSAELPGKVTTTRDGDLTKFEAEGKGEYFSVSIYETGGVEFADTEARLVELRDIFVASKKGKVTKSEPSQLGGFPAIHFVTRFKEDGDPVELSIRYALGKRHLYMFLFSQDPPFKDSLGAERFFKSIELAEPK